MTLLYNLAWITLVIWGILAPITAYLERGKQ